MTVDNLERRGISKHLECQFGLEHESIHHLFFDCVVAKYVWGLYSKFSGTYINSYIDLASKWPCEKSFALNNNISAGVLWGLWLTRNDFVFNNQVWRDVKTVIRRIYLSMVDWKPMYRGDLEQGMAKWRSHLEAALKIPLAISF
jgi:hypothetical protein